MAIHCPMLIITFSKNGVQSGNNRVTSLIRVLPGQWSDVSLQSGQTLMKETYKSIDESNVSPLRIIMTVIMGWNHKKTYYSFNSRIFTPTFRYILPIYPYPYEKKL